MGMAWGGCQAWGGGERLGPSSPVPSWSQHLCDEVGGSQLFPVGGDTHPLQFIKPQLAPRVVQRLGGSGLCLPLQYGGTPGWGWQHPQASSLVRNRLGEWGVSGRARPGFLGVGGAVPGVSSGPLALVPGGTQTPAPSHRSPLCPCPVQVPSWHCSRLSCKGCLRG